MNIQKSDKSLGFGTFSDSSIGLSRFFKSEKPEEKWRGTFQVQKRGNNPDSLILSIPSKTGGSPCELDFVRSRYPNDPRRSYGGKYFQTNEANGFTYYQALYRLQKGQVCQDPSLGKKITFHSGFIEITTRSYGPENLPEIIPDFIVSRS